MYMSTTRGMNDKNHNAQGEYSVIKSLPNNTCLGKFIKNYLFYGFFRRNLYIGCSYPAAKFLILFINKFSSLSYCLSNAGVTDISCFTGFTVQQPYLSFYFRVQFFRCQYEPELHPAFLYKRYFTASSILRG